MKNTLLIGSILAGFYLLRPGRAQAEEPGSKEIPRFLWPGQGTGSPSPAVTGEDWQGVGDYPKNPPPFWH